MPVEIAGGATPTSERWDKMFCLVHGYSGVGKSAFAFSFPPNWHFCNCDRAVGTLTGQLPNSTKVIYEPIKEDDVDVVTPQIAAQYLNKFDKMLNAALAEARRAAKAGEYPGTFVLDGADNFWEWVKIAKVPDYLSGVDAPKEYAPANTYMDNALLRLGQSPINVVFTVFSNKVWTGMKTESDRVKATGFKHMERYLTHEVYLYSPDERTQPEETPTAMVKNKQGAVVARPLGQGHQAVITRSKLNEALLNRVLPNLDFGLLYRLTYGKAYPEAAKLWSPSVVRKAESEQES